MSPNFLPDWSKQLGFSPQHWGLNPRPSHSAMSPVLFFYLLSFRHGLTRSMCVTPFACHALGLNSFCDDSVWWYSLVRSLGIPRSLPWAPWIHEAESSEGVRLGP